MPGLAIAAIQPSPTACSASPMSMNGLLPNRSASAPAIGATSIGAPVHGRVRRPAASGE